MIFFIFYPKLNIGLLNPEISYSILPNLRASFGVAKRLSFQMKNKNTFLAQG